MAKRELEEIKIDPTWMDHITTIGWTPKMLLRIAIVVIVILVIICLNEAF